MSKLSATKKLILEEFSAQRPWIDKLIPPLNQFLEQVYYALVGGLTLADNLKGKKLPIVLKNPTAASFPVKIRWPLNEAPTYVVIGKIGEDSPAPGTIPVHSMQWDYNDGQILVTVNGLDSTKTYNLLIVGQV